MEKDNDLLLYKIVVAVCVVFICVIFFLTTDFSGILKGKKHKKTSEQSVMAGASTSNTVNKTIALEIGNITKGKLIISLPSGVRENNINISKDLINKKVYIEFPMGITEYDFSSIINESSVVSGINHSIKSNIINIEISMTMFADFIETYESKKLILDFFNPADVDMPVVVIDTGHGDYDVGAIENGIYEKDIDLEICLLLKQFLDSENILVYYTRLDDSYPTIEERADFANAISPDLFISIHSNWYENPGISGVSTLYNENDKSEYGSAWLSNILCEEISKGCGIYNKGITSGNEIHIVRHSSVPVALVEMGFMSNPEDFKLLTEPQGQIKVAKSIYSGIIRALLQMGKYHI